MIPNQYKQIIGLDYAKDCLLAFVVVRYQFPELHPLKEPRSFLLYGASGCGKSMLLDSLKGLKHILMDMKTGESNDDFVEKIEHTFLQTRIRKDAILMIEDLDYLMDRNADCLSVFIKSIFRFEGIVIATTQKPWKLHHTISRRFNKKLHIQPLNRNQTKSLTNLELNGYCTRDILQIIQNGYSNQEKVNDVPYFNWKNKFDND